MEQLMFFCLGVLSMLIAGAMVYVQMTVKPKWYTIPLFITGVLIAFFGIAWAGSSFFEGYARSSALGLTLFTGPGLLICAITWRFLVAPGLEQEREEA